MMPYGTCFTVSFFLLAVAGSAAVIESKHLGLARQSRIAKHDPFHPSDCEIPYHSADTEDSTRLTISTLVELCGQPSSESIPGRKSMHGYGLSFVGLDDIPPALSIPIDCLPLSHCV
jgi:hypothetical protein